LRDGGDGGCRIIIGGICIIETPEIINGGLFICPPTGWDTKRVTGATHRSAPEAVVEVVSCNVQWGCRGT